MVEVLTELHGRRIGLGSNDQLIMNGRSIAQSKNTVSGLQRFGAAAGTNVVIGDDSAETGGINYTSLKLTAESFAMTDEAGVVAYTGSKIYDFPIGIIQILGCVVDVTATADAAGVNADWAGDFGVGTVTASNNAALTSTEQNIVSSTAIAAATASVGTLDGSSLNSITSLTDSTGGTANDTIANLADGTTYATDHSDIEDGLASLAAKVNELVTAVTGTRIITLDGTSTAPDMFLNILVDDADQDVTSTATNLLVTGTVNFTWVNLGNY